MENIISKFKKTKRSVYNFTITFDPKSINNKQTWEIPMREIIQGLQDITHPRIRDEPLIHIVNYLVTREPHKKDIRAHMHGQLTTLQPIPINSLSLMAHGLRRMWGRGEFLLNYDRYDIDGNLLNWTEYCLKDVKTNQEKYKDFGYEIIYTNIPG